MGKFFFFFIYSFFILFLLILLIFFFQNDFGQLCLEKPKKIEVPQSIFSVEEGEIESVICGGSHTLIHMSKKIFFLFFYFFIFIFLFLLFFYFYFYFIFFFIIFFFYFFNKQEMGIYLFVEETFLDSWEREVSKMFMNLNY